MTKSQITKVLKKIESQPLEYSLGFKRLTSLPTRVRNNINVSCVTRGESNDNSMKEFLGEMSEADFMNWLKIV